VVPLLHDLDPATEKLESVADNLHGLLKDLRPTLHDLKPTIRDLNELFDNTPGLFDDYNKTAPEADQGPWTTCRSRSTSCGPTPQRPSAGCPTGTRRSPTTTRTATFARIFVQAGSTSLMGNPGIVPPGVRVTPYPLPGQNGGTPLDRRNSEAV